MRHGNVTDLTDPDHLIIHYFCMYEMGVFVKKPTLLGAKIRYFTERDFDQSEISKNEALKNVTK